MGSMEAWLGGLLVAAVMAVGAEQTAGLASRMHKFDAFWGELA